jgi:hypothetical protein
MHVHCSSSDRAPTRHEIRIHLGAFRTTPGASYPLGCSLRESAGFAYCNALLVKSIFHILDRWPDWRAHDDQAMIVITGSIVQAIGIKEIELACVIAL